MSGVQNINSKEPQRNRHGIKRVHSGCLTCKKRKVKCDESKPECERCRRGNRTCLGYDNVQNSAAKKRARDSQINDRGAPDINIGNVLTARAPRDASFVDSWTTKTNTHNLDPAFLNVSTDDVWHELLNSFTLMQETDQATMSSSNNNLMSLASVVADNEDFHEVEDDLIRSARAAYEEVIYHMDFLAIKAFNQSLRWFPPAFSKSKGLVDDSFFCQLEKEPWSRAFLHLSSRSTLVRSFLVSIGTLYGSVQDIENYQVEQIQPIETIKRGKQEYARAMKGLRTLRLRITTLQKQLEWSSDDFCLITEYIAGVILFMAYEELDRSMIENGLGLWTHAIDIASQMPELHCIHSFRTTCDITGVRSEAHKRASLCGRIQQKDIDLFRILIRILYWKDTLYKAIGPGATADSKSFFKSIRAWEKGDPYSHVGCLRSSSISSMALWTPDLLDIVACATQSLEDKKEDILECLLCRIRMARLSTDLIEDEEISNRRGVLFDVLRFTVQILVMLTLDPQTKLKENDLLRIQASLKICHVATSNEAINIEWDNESNVVDTQKLFDDVRNYLHLHLAFPFVLAATQIKSESLQEALLLSLQKLSSNESSVRVADRGKDSILFLRLLLQKIYTRSQEPERSGPLKKIIQAAIHDCYFAEGTQLLAT